MAKFGCFQLVHISFFFCWSDSILQAKQEVLPEFEIGILQVVVPYPGAAAEEVEQGIVLALEKPSMVLTV